MSECLKIVLVAPLSANGSRSLLCSVGEEIVVGVEVITLPLFSCSPSSPSRQLAPCLPSIQAGAVARRCRSVYPLPVPMPRQLTPSCLLAKPCKKQYVARVGAPVALVALGGLGAGDM